MIYQHFTEINSQIQGLVLVDRDNTLIYDSGYFHNENEVTFIPSTVEALKRLTGKSVPIMLVSNQAGIGLKKFTFDDAISVNRRIHTDMKGVGINISGAVFCPHTQHENCDFRKPNTGMIDFCRRLSGLTNDRMYFLGDKESDRLAATKAGVTFGWTHDLTNPLQIASWVDSLC